MPRFTRQAGARDSARRCAGSSSIRCAGPVVHAWSRPACRRRTTDAPSRRRRSWRRAAGRFCAAVRQPPVDRDDDQEEGDEVEAVEDHRNSGSQPAPEHLGVVPAIAHVVAVRVQVERWQLGVARVVVEAARRWPRARSAGRRRSAAASATAAAASLPRGRRCTRTKHSVRPCWRARSVISGSTDVGRSRAKSAARSPPTGRRRRRRADRRGRSGR